MPNGTVWNHSMAGSFDAQYDGAAMKDSIVPCEAAGKQSKAGMICPSPKVSILNRPPVASSTSFASRCADPCITSRLVGQVVDIRH